jgi:hypothetical protein
MRNVRCTLRWCRTWIPGLLIGALPPTTGKRKDGNPGRHDKTTAIYSCGPYQPGREEPDENLEREEELPEECDPPLTVEPVK